MLIKELWGKPIWQTNGEELPFLARHSSQPSNTNTEASVSKEQKRYVYSLSGIVRLFGCSLPTANRIKQNDKMVALISLCYILTFINTIFYSRLSHRFLLTINSHLTVQQNYVYVTNYQRFRF